MMPKMRTAIIVYGTEPVNAVVLSPDPAAAAAYCTNFTGVCIVPDPADEYGTEFLTLTGCVAVEVTHMEPKPGVGSGWTFVDGEFVAPPEPELPEPELPEAE
jgi:hypothetical protein